MTGLALCAGVGGLELGIEIAFPKYRCIAAVENNPQAAHRFKLRFPQARIFRNVVGFDGRPFRNRVDCISAGFPCQPHSVAGSRKGTGDERWIWPDIARIIGEIEPTITALENVAGLLRDAGGNPPGDLEESPDNAFGGMGEVLRDLAAMGFVAIWGSLRAAQVGANHGRHRVFILAYNPSRGFRIHRSAPGEQRHIDECNGAVENARCSDWRQPHAHDQLGQWPPIDQTTERTGNGMVDAAWTEPATGRSGRRRGIRGTGDYLGIFAPGPSDAAWFDILAANPHLAPALSPVTATLAIALQQGEIDFQAEIESRFCGLADGVARWLVERRPRLQCGGNGVVPLQAATVFTVLAKRIGLIQETPWKP